MPRVSAIIAGLSTPLTNALNAVGQIKITMMLMIFWTVATWILTITLIHFIGFNGFAVGLLIQSLTIFIVVKITQRFAAFSFVEYIKWPVLAGLLQGALYYVARGSMPYSIPRLVIVAGAGVILYGGVVWVKQKERILDIIHISR